LLGLAARVSAEAASTALLIPARFRLAIALVLIAIPEKPFAPAGALLALLLVRISVLLCHDQILQVRKSFEGE
jgi:hypothetical protein